MRKFIITYVKTSPQGNTGQRTGARHLPATTDVERTSSLYPTYVTNGVAIQATNNMLKIIF